MLEARTLYNGLCGYMYKTCLYMSLWSPLFDLGVHLAGYHGGLLVEFSRLRNGQQMIYSGMGLVQVIGIRPKIKKMGFFYIMVCVYRYIYIYIHMYIFIYLFYLFIYLFIYIYMDGI